MRRIHLIPLLAFLIACGDRGPIGPDEGPVFAKKCESPPCDKDGKGPGDGGGGEYAVWDLGTLFGGNESSSRGLGIGEPDNGAVSIVGFSDDGSGSTAATLWTVSGTSVTAPERLPDGGESSGAYAINGDVAVGHIGSFEPWAGGTSRQPVRWDKLNGWTADTLEPLEGYDFGVANDVNGGGQIVGWSEKINASGLLKRRATLWGADLNPVQLPSLTENETAQAGAISESGYIVGYSWGAFTLGEDDPYLPPGETAHYLPHAVLWKSDKNGAYAVCNLHAWPYTESHRSSAYAVVDAGTDGGSAVVQVAGRRDLFPRGEAVATVWTVTVNDLTCLATVTAEPSAWPAPSGVDTTTLGSSAYALDIIGTTDAGWEAVGHDHSSGKARPVLWRLNGGPVEQIALPSLKGDEGAATGINSAGQIVGWTKAGKERHAVLWTRNP